MLALRIVTARSAAEMDRLEPLWKRILEQQEHTIFQRFSWNRLAAEIFQERMQPMVVAVESDAGVAIVPAALGAEGSCAELLGESLFDYRDVLHTGNPEVLRRAWEPIADLAVPFYATAIENFAIGQRWSRSSLQLFAKAPMVDSQLATEAAFRSAHSRMGRQMRRMEKRGLTLRLATGAESELVRRIYDLKCDQFAGDPHNVFRDARRREFMVAVCALEGAACTLFTLQDQAGCIVAALVTFRDGRVRRFYTIYFDPAWAQHSPGVTLVYEATALSLAEGLSCDYMTGEYPYKLRFANASRQLWGAAWTGEELAAMTKQEAAA
jgi:CelD/BcsL family acetyltransferase involved in cellulose biosynthesis